MTTTHMDVRAPELRGPRFHVFLSHNRQDRPIVEQIAERLLEEAGLSSWIDIWMLQGGADWERAIDEALRACPSCAVFVGESGWGPFHRRESVAAQERAKNDPAFRLIPVLLPGFSESVLAEEAALFERWQQVDLSSGISDNEGFRRLAAAIAGSEPFLDGRTRLTPTRIRRDAAQWRDATSRAKRSYLYSGHKLADAENQLREHATQFNEVAVKFLAASTQASRRRALQWSIGLSAALVFSGGLSWYAFRTATERDEQRRQAQARYLASEGALLRVRQPEQLELSVLLAVESHLRYPTPEGADALRQAVGLLQAATFEGELGPDSKLDAGVRSVLFKDAFSRTVDVLFPTVAAATLAAAAVPTQDDIADAIDRIVDSVNSVLITDNGDRVAVQATLYDEGDFQESEYLPTVILFTRQHGKIHKVDVRPGDGVAMSENGLRVALWRDETHDVVVMDFSEPPRVAFSRRFDGSVGTVTLSPDGSLVGIERAGVLRVFSVNSGREVGRPKYPEETSSVAFSDDNTLVAMIAGDARARGVVYSLDGLDIVALGSGGNVGALSPDGCLAATTRSFAYGAAVLHHVCGGQGTDLSGEYGTEAMQLTSHGRFLLSKEAGRASLKALPGEEEVWSASAVRAAAISDNGHTLVTSDEQGTVYLFQGMPPHEIGRIPMPSKHVAAVALAGNGLRAATLEEHRASVLTVLPTAKTAEFLVSGAKLIALGSQGQRLAVAGRTLDVFDISSGRRIVSIALNGVPEFLRFTADERYVGLASRTDVRVIDTQGGTEVYRDTARAISAIMFSDDDDYLQLLDGSTVTRTLWKPESFASLACARVARKGLTCEEWDRYLKGEAYRPTCVSTENRHFECSAFRLDAVEPGARTTASATVAAPARNR